MPRVVLAPALVRWLREPPPSAGDVALDVDAATARDALERTFARWPELRGYVVDEHGAVRHHVAVFVDGVAVRDKARLATPLAAGAEVYVMQALSGG